MSRLKKLHDKATPGVWRAHKVHYPIQKKAHTAILSERTLIDDGGRVVAQYLTPKDAALIVYMHENAVRLVELIEAARELTTVHEQKAPDRAQQMWRLRSALRALDESA